MVNIIKNAHEINGLYYISDYLTDDEINMLTEKIRHEVELNPIYGATSRRVAHYGFNYSYDRSGLTKAKTIPEDLSDLVRPKRLNKILGNDLLESNFNQLIINEYLPGQKIAYHVDHTKQFGDIIACISLGSDVDIKFKNGDVIKLIKVEDGSLYVMTGDARYKWQHSLVNDTRKTRYSFTYRLVNQ
jgi:alkylated DNA repair dioxygenase AlkB